MTLDRIHAAIPHRKPMLLVDEIVEQSEDRIVCRKTFHEDEFFFQGHYPSLQKKKFARVYCRFIYAGQIPLFRASCCILE